ncbi:unnamed protein product [Diamesa serratosioi]
MENNFFTRSTSKDEYLAYVAKFIIRDRDESDRLKHFRKYGNDVKPDDDQDNTAPIVAPKVAPKVVPAVAKPLGRYASRFLLSGRGSKSTIITWEGRKYMNFSAKQEEYSSVKVPASAKNMLNSWSSAKTGADNFFNRRFDSTGRPVPYISPPSPHSSASPVYVPKILTSNHVNFHPLPPTYTPHSENSLSISPSVYDPLNSNQIIDEPVSQKYPRNVASESRHFYNPDSPIYSANALNISPTVHDPSPSTIDMDVFSSLMYGNDRPVYDPFPTITCGRRNSNEPTYFSNGTTSSTNTASLKPCSPTIDKKDTGKRSENSDIINEPVTPVRPIPQIVIKPATPIITERNYVILGTDQRSEKSSNSTGSTKQYNTTSNSLPRVLLTHDSIPRTSSIVINEPLSAVKTVQQDSIVMSSNNGSEKSGPTGSNKPQNTLSVISPLERSSECTSSNTASFEPCILTIDTSATVLLGCDKGSENAIPKTERSSPRKSNVSPVDYLARASNSVVYKPVSSTDSPIATNSNHKQRLQDLNSKNRFAIDNSKLQA